MATAPASARSAKIPARKIGADDLRASLKAGWDDFMAMRGDLIFLGLLYPLIGFAAAVFTLNGPLMPFFFPVVAGVGLLGPVAAVGFYELARRREEGLDLHWSHFLDVRKRPAADDIGIVAGLLLAIFFAVDARRRSALCRAVRLDSPRLDPAVPHGGLHDAHGLGSDRHWRTVSGSLFGWVVLALSVVSLPMLVDRDVSAADAVSASWRAAQCEQARNDALGTDRRSSCS